MRFFPLYRFSFDKMNRFEKRCFGTCESQADQSLKNHKDIFDQFESKQLENRDGLFDEI